MVDWMFLTRSEMPAEELEGSENVLFIYFYEKILCWKYFTRMCGILARSFRKSPDVVDVTLQMF